MSPKVVIIVLVVIALLFALVLVAGASRERDTTADTEHSTWAQLLKKLYREERVRPSELRGDCLKGDTFLLAPGSPCGVTIAAAEKYGTPVRTAVLRLAQGVEAKVVYTPDSGGGQTEAGGAKESDDALSMPLSLKLKAGEETKLQVMGKGGTLQLTCVKGGGTPARCQVQLN